jgi:hypothetical protein
VHDGDLDFPNYFRRRQGFTIGKKINPQILSYIIVTIHHTPPTFALRKEVWSKLACGQHLIQVAALSCINNNKTLCLGTLEAPQRCWQHVSPNAVVSLALLLQQ